MSKMIMTVHFGPFSANKIHNIGYMKRKEGLKTLLKNSLPLVANFLKGGGTAAAKVRFANSSLRSQLNAN
ncbi:hypothetical protein [Methanolapillus ohkumae]|uniref:hypothetical protein n=1 Tax=Methanolapillus ohkumae TaxID=3028298 RepID=UPI0030B8EE6B